MRSILKAFRLPPRWIDISFYSVLGAVFGLPLGAVLRSAFTGFQSGLAGMSVVLPWLAPSTFLIGALWFLWSLIRPRFAHFGHMAQWPPTLSGVPLSFWLITICVVIGRDTDDPARWIEILAWLNLSISSTGFLFFAIAKAQQQRQASTVINPAFVDRPRARELLTALPLPQLNGWIDSEAPVVNCESDWFQAAPRARRVLKALQTRRTDGDADSYQSVVIQGPFGSGKTSTTLIVKDSAMDQVPHMLFVYVDCWGFSTVAGQEFILEKAVTVLQENVDCLSLRRLPHSYAEALKEGSDWMGAIAQLVDATPNPDAVLERFTPILKAMDIRLVFVIEDTDRNDSDFDQRKLQAMLYRLKKIERLSFILTAGEKSEIDFPKIAEVVEPITVLAPEFSAIMLARTLNDCTCTKAWDFINPRLWFSDEGENLANISPLEDEYEPSMGLLAISSLIRTPRELKYVLRDLRHVWDSLKGEVDLYELLCVLTVQHCASPAFNFIILHYREFSLISSEDEEQSDEENRVNLLSGQLSLAIERSTANPQQLRTVLARILPGSLQPGFPHWFESQARQERWFETKLRWPIFSSQTVFSNRSLIYWDRLLTRTTGSDNYTDQEILKQIKDALFHNDFKTFTESCLASPFNRAAVSLFIDGTPGLKQRLEKDFAWHFLRSARPYRLSEFHSVNDAFVWIRGWLGPAQEGSIESSELRKQFLVEIQNAMTTDLDDAICLFEFAKSHFHNAKEFKHLRQKALKAFQKSWKCSDGKFVSLVRPDFYTTLRDILRNVVCLPTSMHRKGKHFNWLVSLILHELAMEPTRMGIQLYRAFQKKDTGGFDILLLKAFFKNNSMTVLRLVAQSNAQQEGLSKRDKEFGQRVCEYAENALKVAQAKDKNDAVSDGPKT